MTVAGPEAEIFAGLVSNVGFPIAAFIGMFYMAHTSIKDNTEALRELKNEIQRRNNE